MGADLVIRNGRYVLPGGAITEGLGIVIDDGVIQMITRAEQTPDAEQVIDAAGKYVLPGLIDPHVHTRAPGYEYKEDLFTCSAAAAAGGITTMLAMFNVNPMVQDVESYRSFVEYAAPRSIVNFNVNAVLTERNFEQVPALAEAGVASFKVLLGYKFDVSGSGGRPDVAGISAPDDGGLLEAMEIIAATDVPLVVHAENDSIIKRRQAALQARGETGPMAHMQARPRVAADEAISRLIRFSEETGCRLHILHLASGNGVQMVRAAQLKGLPVTCETCPHFLLLTNEEHVAKLGSVAKTNPPIRTKWDQEQLWKGVENRAVVVIGTDHAPHTNEEKMVDRPFDDIFKAMAGWPGVETGVPLMLTQVNEGRLSLPRFVELYSTDTAKLFGLYPERGALQVGSAGDVTIVDMKREGTIDAAGLHSKSKATPFDGWKLSAMPTHTVVGGRVVYAEGEVLGQGGEGQYVPSHHARL